MKEGGHEGCGTCHAGRHPKLVTDKMAKTRHKHAWGRPKGVEGFQFRNLREILEAKDLKNFWVVNFGQLKLMTLGLLDHLELKNRGMQNKAKEKSDR